MAMRMVIPTRMGLSKRMFSSFAFAPPPTAAAANAPPPAEPSDNLFVSGLNKRTTTEGLTDAFAKFGEVIQAKVITDRVSGYSKGFGFVKYATIDDAAEGIKGMDGKFLDGWVIFAEYARPRPSYNGGGGYANSESPPTGPANSGSPPPYSSY